MKIQTLVHKGFGPIVEDKFRRVGTSLISGSLRLAGQPLSHDTELHLYAHVCIGTAKLVSLLSPRNSNMQYNFSGHLTPKLFFTCVPYYRLYRYTGGNS